MSAPGHHHEGHPPGGFGQTEALLLSQVGLAAAGRFADAVAQVGLTPPLAGILRLIAARPGLSQQELARMLGTAPSRVVRHLDDLEARDAIARRPGRDRRVNVVTLTGDGEHLLSEVRRIALAHNEGLLAALDPDQRRALRESLTILAGGLGITALGHPGFAASAE